jgi:hypothetical protein
MSVSREELEQMALQAVSVEDHYELLDTLEETPDEDLWAIVNGTKPASE